MALANESDFLGEGTVDPFTARAQPLTLAQQAALKDNEVRRNRTAAQTTATTNLGYNQERAKDQGGTLYVGEDAAERKAQDLASGISGKTYRTPAEQKKWEETHQRGFGGNLIRDPVTMGVLAAPWAVMGAGALLPAAVGGVEGAAAIPSTAATLGAAESAAAAEAAFTAPAVAGGATSAVPAAGTVAAGTTAAGTTAAAVDKGLKASDWINIGGTALSGGMLLNDLFGGQSDAEKNLIAKQEQLAEETKIRNQQMQVAGMNSLGQRLLAFDPQNQMMAQMFGPEAAFAPEQFAQMAENPMGPPPLYQSQDPTGTDPGEQAKVVQSQQAKAAYDEQEKQRREMIVNGMSPLPQGPTPLRPTTPQAARRY